MDRHGPSEGDAERRRSPDAEAADRLAAPRKRAEGAEGERGISYPGFDPAHGVPGGRGAREYRPGDPAENLGKAPPDGTVKVLRRPREPTAEARRETITNGFMNRVVTGAQQRGGWARASGAASHSRAQKGRGARARLRNGFLSQKRPQREAAEEEWLHEPEASEEGQEASPILGEKGRTDKWVVGIPLPSKGTGHSYCENALEMELRRGGR